MGRFFDRSSNNRIEIATLPDFTDKITVSAWVRVNNAITAGQFYTIFSKAKDSNDRNFGLDYRVLDGGKSLEVYWTQPVGTFIEYFNQDQNLGSGIWHQVVATVDWSASPNEVHIYRNGSDISLINHPIGTDDTLPTTGSPSLQRIGGLIDASGSAWDGDIAELAIWADALSAGEALALAHFSPMVVRPAGMLLYAPLINDLMDYTGLRSLTNQGTAPSDSHPPIIYAG